MNQAKKKGGSAFSIERKSKFPSRFRASLSFSSIRNWFTNYRRFLSGLMAEESRGLTPKTTPSPAAEDPSPSLMQQYYTPVRSNDRAVLEMTSMDSRYSQSVADRFSFLSFSVRWMDYYVSDANHFSRCLFRKLYRKKP